MASILVVEDEALVAMMLEDLICQAGHEVFGVAPTVARAELLLAEGRPDAALLDVRPRAGDMSYPVAAELHRLGVTGYAEHTIDKSSRPVAVLRKPVGFADVTLALKALLAPAP